MSQHYLGQIMMTGFVFAPKYFAQCNGQLLSIAQNQALFSLLGTNYGGNGVQTFALPDLRSRTPVSANSSVSGGWQPPLMSLGQVGGQENVTLLQSNVPGHGHQAYASAAPGNNRNPSTRLFATSTNTSAAASLYAPSTGAAVVLNQQSVASAGANQPHPNIQPYCTLNFCIALAGIFPSRN